MERYDNINWNNVVKEYLEDKISLTKLGIKYGVARNTIANRLKKLGVEIVNRQNKVKFNNKIFDSIDSEEKAYWLGFIFADGYISGKETEYQKNRYCFELSLKGSDKKHLDNFNKFMEHEDSNHVSLEKTICKNNSKECKRCRWCIANKHFWEILNSYGCTPQKSLTLCFPSEEIFKDKSLIRHFIRGYFDGDGCFSRHICRIIVSPVISIIGTPSFLDSLEKILGYKSNRTKKNESINTESLNFSKENGIKFINYIYENSNIYLDRKYKLYQFFKNGSRSVQEWTELQQTENGEVCDDNPVLSLEIKESEPV